MSKGQLTDDGGAERRADTAAASSWVHPGDAMDGAELGGASDGGADQLSRFFRDLVPGEAHCGGPKRQSRAAYNLFCATLFRTSPAFVNGRTGKEMARDLGIQYSTWKKHVERADTILARMGVRPWRGGRVG